jgi:ribosomal protein L14
MWLQTRSKITIKDNSGLVKGRVIHGMSFKKSLFSKFKLAITKTKIKSKHKKSHRYQKSQTNPLANAFILQTKRTTMRFDGSTIGFNVNSAVTVTGSKNVLGFQVVHTSVPFEIKRRLKLGSANVIKLAKSLL